MAEGGSVKTTKKSSIDSRLLECPICLEQLKTPKSLPCLHSFCQECLSTYIIKELTEQNTSSSSSFSCPVCRNTTYPLNASEDKSLWAKQFPTNNLATEMIQLMGKPDKPYFCMPCQKKGDTEVPAVFWCKMYKTLLCETCKVNHHDMMHGDCDITTITEEFTLAQNQYSNTNKCERHKKKMEYFCEDHQFIGCSKCITIDHRRCEVVTTTEEYCEKLTKSSQLDDREKLLEESKDCLETLSKNLDEELDILANDREEALKSISDQRRKISEYFDGKQQEITDDLMSKVKDRNDLLDVSRTECERLKVAITKTLESSKLCRTNKKDMETVLLFQRGKRESESCNELVAKIRELLTPSTVKHVINSAHSLVESETSFNMGRVVIEKAQEKVLIDESESFPFKVSSEKNPGSRAAPSQYWEKSQGKVLVDESESIPFEVSSEYIPGSRSAQSLHLEKAPEIVPLEESEFIPFEVSSEYYSESRSVPSRYLVKTQEMELVHESESFPFKMSSEKNPRNRSAPSQYLGKTQEMELGHESESFPFKPSSKKIPGNRSAQSRYRVKISRKGTSERI